MTNGVDLSVFKPAPNPRSVGGPWRLVSVGPLSTAFKGIEFVLAAIAKLKGTGYPVHFTRFPVGSVTDFERKAALVDASVYSVSEREVAQVLQKSHVLLAGSLEAEGFGLPALEAMASGIPCVLTRVPCYLNLNSRADFAHFVTPRHPQEMADGVVRLMTDEGYRRKIVERGLEVVRHYSLDHLGDRLADFFTAIHEQGVAGNTLINRWSR